MADTIGIELDADTLVLTRGRDFKWLFENQDQNGSSVDYPAGDLYFALDTGGAHNAIQQVEVTGASGGAYSFSHGGETTSPIGYYDVTTNPRSLADDVATALEALGTIGDGNVFVHPAQLIPVWEIKLTLDSGHNEVQLISFTNPPTSGNWKLGLGTAATAALAYNATAAQVQTALEALAGIGVGNVSVTGDMTNGFRVEFIGAKANTNVGQLVGYSSGTDLNIAGWFFGLFGPLLGGQSQPSSSVVKVQTLIQGQARFNSLLVDTLTTTLTGFFGSYASLSGVNVEVTVHDGLNATVKVTSLKSFNESALITFAVDVNDNSIIGVLNNVAALNGVFDTVHVDFYWNHEYQIEFVGDLANTTQPEIGVDYSDLTGPTNAAAVAVSVLKPGKPRYTKWHFGIEGSVASLVVQSEDADLINPRTNWQLVFLPEGEAKGGDPIARGRVAVQE